ncbi:MAG: CoA pyrophosphatase [Bacteroidetes bacterium HGW-Bacteroidetes-15]|nr:MAG: CoA pyrophosphatase [Bacteroidetes bacterium HGW-Bacteroidetes-15]
MHAFNNIVKSLKINLAKDLPGLSSQLKMAPALRDRPEFPKSPNSATKNSAVLISIFPDNKCAKTILIKRTVYKGVHSGQISFPGGKADDSDVNLIETALREAEEEVGINPSEVEVLGTLTSLFIPVSNILVVPVVGVIPKPKKLHLNLQEVEYTISVDLMQFKDIRNISVKTISVNSLSISAPYYSVENEVVWGATAMLISELTELF